MALALTAVGSACAEGLAPLGARGGLVVPTARTLAEGNIELALSNLPEPGLLGVGRQRSAVLGIGIFEGLEVSGRFAEYATRQDGSIARGISDLSLNAKLAWSSSAHPAALRLGAGLLDFGGAATKFRAGYLVGTQALGPWEWTLGVGKSQALIFENPHKRALDGVFGSLAYELAPATAPAGRWEALLEHDTRQPLAGVRWSSPLLPGLASARLVGSLHRSFPAGSAHPAATVWTVGMSWPLGAHEARRAVAEPLVANEPARGSSVPEAARTSASARLAELQAALRAQGLERVRVGRLADGTWVVAYENHRFGQNEVDALGLVLGLAAERAPEELRSLVVLVLKQGQPVLTVRTEPTLWRNFVQSGLPGMARGHTVVQRGRTVRDTEVDWLSDAQGPRTWLQLQLRPELSHTVGTEIGVTDYSLAGRLTATVPLWRGGQLVAAAQSIVSHSERARVLGPFEGLRQTEGLHTLALQHTFWLGQRVVASGSVGRFEYGAYGAEGSALVFLPWGEDVLRLRGRAVEKTPSMPAGADLAGAASYRWAPSPTLWVELGTQRYTSGNWGPMVSLTRWWGEVGVQLFFRKAGWRQFAGLEFQVPLTPRSARAWGPVQVQGPTAWPIGLRSMVGNQNNYVEPRQARDLRLTWDLETQAFSAGRLSPEYVLSQFARMRESYLYYGKP